MNPEPAHSDRMLFLKKFLQHGTRVASIAPSSPQLAAELCRAVTTERPQVIIELGAGTGAVTAAAAARMHPQSRLFAIELDTDFAAILRTRCPRVEVITADVSDARRELADRGITRADLIISGLPMPSLPQPVVRAVLDLLRTVAAGAAPFSQLTVMPWVYQRFYQQLFSEVRFVPVWQNLPPGGVYHCYGPRVAR